MIETVLQGSQREIEISLSNRVILNHDYLRLDNKPSINGVTLTGNKNSNDLNLLSNKGSDYTEVSVKSVAKTDFLLTLSNTLNPKKVKVSDITSHLSYTANSMPQDLEVGNYVFLLKEENK